MTRFAVSWETVKTVTGEIALRIRGVEVRSKLTVPADAVHPRKVLPALQQLTGDIVAAMVQASPEPVSCCAGCVACCSQLVGTSTIEARNLRRVVEDMPAERRAVVLGRFSSARQRLDEAGLLESLRAPSGSLHELGLRYLSLNIPCPFLEEGCCSVYPERPLACREHLVTSPASNCSQPTAETIQLVPMPARVSNALIQISRTPWTPLILAMEVAAQGPDGLAHRAGPELMDEVVEYLST